VLHDFDIDDFKSKPPDSTCTSFPFIYNQTGYVITVTLVFAKVPKYREPKSINWKHNFKILMDSVEEYARQWEKREKEDLDTLSEWVKSVRSLIQIRIKKLSGSICYVWWTCFSTDSRHIYGYKLCSSSRRRVPLFV